jgi:hypothetical protein
MSNDVPSSNRGERPAQRAGQVHIMRLLNLLPRVLGYGAVWLGIVLLCGLIGLFLPLLWNIGQPSSSEDYGQGLLSFFCGALGLLLGTLAATISVMLLSERNSQRSRD